MSKQALGNFETSEKTPEDLAQALERRDFDTVLGLLENAFEEVARGKYEWLNELVDVGYSWKDIPELLLEEAIDAPWIYSDPQDQPNQNAERLAITSDDFSEYLTAKSEGNLLLKTNYSPWMRSDPPDKLAQDLRPPVIVPDDALKILLWERRTAISKDPINNAFSNSPWTSKQYGVKKTVQQLCGVGGIAPASRYLEDWNGEVIFEDNFSISYISYSISSYKDRNNRLSRVAIRLNRVLESFCKAAIALQGAGLCLDYFTVAQIPATPNTSTCSVGLERVSIYSGIRLYQVLDRLSFSIFSIEDDRRTLLKCARDILSSLEFRDFPILETDSTEDILHLCCLAAQFLCVGLVSFCQGHIGTMDSIFTNHSQERSVLLGSRTLTEDGRLLYPYIAVRLTKLTCLAEMTGGPLITFSWMNEQLGESNESLEITQETLSDKNATKISRLGLDDFFAGESVHNIEATPEDILYTWGPGRLVPFEGDREWLQSIHIGGGVIYYQSESGGRLHWEAGTGPKTYLERPFYYQQRITVGAPVTKNLTQCSFDWKVWRLSCPLVHLAVRSEEWTVNQRQLGLQVGPDHVALQGMQVWSKTPAKLLKEFQLQQGDSGLMEFLGCYVGVQVSCCTGVARRISLQELLGDLMPKFCVTHMGEMDWNDWNNKCDIVRGLCGKDVHEWLFKLRRNSPEAYTTLLEHFRRILNVLEPTGLNRERTHIKIAWPKEGDLHRGIKVSCEDKHLWAQVLADSQEGVTFAYMTTTCLVCEDSSCPPKPQESKRKIPKCLGTAVTLYRNEVVEEEEEEEDNVASSSAPWTLQNGQSYHMWNEKRCIRLKANASLPSSQQYRLMASESAIPSHILKRHFRGRRFKKNLLKEKHHPDDAAVDVLILDEAKK